MLFPISILWVKTEGWKYKKAPCSDSEIIRLDSLEKTARSVKIYIVTTVQSRFIFGFYGIERCSNASYIG